MKAILRRIRLILNSLVHAVLSSAADPRQTFALAHDRQRQMLEKVQQAQRRLHSAQRQLVDKSETANERLPRLEEQARRAVADDQLAIYDVGGWPRVRWSEVLAWIEGTSPDPRKRSHDVETY